MNALNDLVAGNAAPSSATAAAPRGTAVPVSPDAVQAGTDAAAAATRDPAGSFEVLLATLAVQPATDGTDATLAADEAPTDAAAGAAPGDTAASSEPVLPMADPLASLWQMLPGRNGTANPGSTPSASVTGPVWRGPTNVAPPNVRGVALAPPAGASQPDSGEATGPAPGPDAPGTTGLMPLGIGVYGTDDAQPTRGSAGGLEAAAATTNSTTPASPSAAALQATAPAASPVARDAATNTASAHPARSTITTPVGTPGWSDELARQLNLLIDRGDQSATLRLSPEHLGPLEVRISVREGEANVWFGAAHAETRGALEAGLPRLRELLAGSGLALTQSGVSGRDPRDPAGLMAPPRSPPADSVSPGEGDERALSAAALRSLRLLDVYA